MPKKEPRYKSLVIDDIDDIDYKNVALLQKFTSSYGKIVPRRKSGISAKAQRRLAREIKRARYLALLPYVAR